MANVKQYVEALNIDALDKETHAAPPVEDQQLQAVQPQKPQ